LASRRQLTISSICHSTFAFAGSEAWNDCLEGWQSAVLLFDKSSYNGILKCISLPSLSISLIVIGVVLHDCIIQVSVYLLGVTDQEENYQTVCGPGRTVVLVCVCPDVCSDNNC